MICELCDREILAGDESTHHLTPKMVKKKDRRTSTLHEVCHKQIHALYRERVLANHLNTISALKDDENIRRFIKWISKRPPGFNMRARMSNIRR